MSKFSFKIKQSNFISKINFVKSIMSTRNALPIIDNIVITVSDEGIVTLKSTDLETTMEIKINVESYTNYGSACVDANKLKSIVSEIAADDIIEVIIDGNKATIKKPNGKYSLPAESTDEYPLTTLDVTDSGFKIATKTLLSIFKKTNFAASDDCTRPILSGVYLNVADNKVIGVATDSYVLSLCKVNAEANQMLDKYVVIPIKAVKSMSNLFDNKNKDSEVVTVIENESYFVVHNDNFTIHIRKIDGKYPNYSSVIPKNNDKVIKVLLSELVEKVKRVSTCSNKDRNDILLEVVGNELKLTAEDTDFGVSGCDKMGLEEKSGDDVKIKIKSSLFLDGLNNIGSKKYVFIEMSNGSTPILIKSDVSEDDLILVTPLV